MHNVRFSRVTSLSAQTFVLRSNLQEPKKASKRGACSHEKLMPARGWVYECMQRAESKV